MPGPEQFSTTNATPTLKSPAAARIAKSSLPCTEWNFGSCGTVSFLVDLQRTMPSLQLDKKDTYLFKLRDVVHNCKCSPMWLERMVEQRCLVRRRNCRLHYLRLTFLIILRIRVHVNRMRGLAHSTASLVRIWIGKESNTRCRVILD
jgi:hypothetical protein